MPYYKGKSKKNPRVNFAGSGKITKLEFQKTNAERVNVFLDDEYAFSLSGLLVAENHLRSGVELDTNTVAELQAADLYHLGLAAALDLISLRPRSITEIRQRLRQRYPAITDETSDKVITRLQDLGYLDDAKFADFWVENRANFAPRGRLLIKQELAKKGVDRDNIQAALEQHLPAEDENGQNIEEEQAIIIARKKAHSLRAADWPTFYRKMGSFLQRRGYSYEITSRISKQIWRELTENEPAEEEEI